ncbi:MarR family transcriptional regulator [Amycolatopsis acidicola]|uniref:MarR family transcriptional regulator n=1 Tax=Amycolatopsis acidicola TaxID=2596893 RepID=A0A5N0V6G0_9PSEU|nr:MarR family transcriptional regulator [Amycolatopsis acidicola]KAA9162019.1 MarR family transcriptional regulator [Amycolatopsis acidicola]
MNAEARELTDLFATSSLGAPEKAVGFVLWRVLHRYVREIDHALAPLDLTHLQFTTLTMAAWLARSGEPVTQAALARHGDISTMQVSHMLKALEGKAMVTRPRSEKDVRSKEIRVTTTGVAVLREALPVAIEVQRRLFGAGDELLTRLLEVEEAGDRRR